jgi:hypothetical protein
MDLRRIVEEVEERRREHYAMAPPHAPPRAPTVQGGGATASILETVRDRMLREDPRADVAHLNAIIEPDASTPPPQAPRTKLAAEPVALTVAREADKVTDRARAKETGDAARRRAPRDDFLSRYLVLSEEFERRYKVKGWTNLVRKKCSSELRR